MRIALVAVAAVASAAGLAAATDTPTNPAAAVLKAPIVVATRDVKWESCSAALPPGAQCARVEGELAAPNVLFTYRVKVPDGYRIGPHFHPADEHLTVLSGTFNVGHGRQFDAKALVPLSAGSFAVMPKGHAHFATASGETIVQVHAIGPWGITYVNPADDPRTREQ